jgi:ribosome-associated translation inhibitor RaiA
MRITISYRGVTVSAVTPAENANDAFNKLKDKLTLELHKRRSK